MARGSTTQRWLLDAWVVLLMVVLTWPMWTRRGYGLARDLIFTPERPLTLDAIGLGSSLPRAVPLDAVLSLGTMLVGGEVVFRICVAGVLVAAGWGAHRALPDRSVWSGAAMATAAVWNPFVIERLAMGQWALLSAYAAAFWLLPVMPEVLRGENRWSVVVLGFVLASLTPTGGALVMLLALAAMVVLRNRPSVQMLALAAACQLPWVLPSLLGPHQATSDPAGARAFAPQGGPAGTLVSLLGGGGIWNPFATPGSQDTWFAALAAAVFVGSVGFGASRIWRMAPALLVAAGVGLLLAALTTVPGGASVLSWLAAEIPGGGLFRDGQKWVLLYMVSGVLGLGLLTERLGTACRGADATALVGVLLVALPVIAVPDGPGTTWEVLYPVRYPADFDTVVSTLDAASDNSGDTVTLPWASYRLYSWGRDLSAADPLPRWSRRPVVVSGSLATADGDLAGEDPRAAGVGRVLAGPVDDMSERLGDLGIGWVVRYKSAQGGQAVPDLPGLTTVLDGRDVRLERVDATVAPQPEVGRTRLLLVVLVDVLIGLVGGAAAVNIIRRRIGRRSGPTTADAC